MCIKDSGGAATQSALRTVLPVKLMSWLHCSLASHQSRASRLGRWARHTKGAAGAEGGKRGETWEEGEETLEAVQRMRNAQMHGVKSCGLRGVVA